MKSATPWAPDPVAMETRQRLLIINDRFGQKDIADIPHPGIEVTFAPETSREQFLNLIPDFDAYLSTSRCRVDRAVVDRAARLRLIGTPSTGTDHLDLKLLEERGIAVQSIRT